MLPLKIKRNLISLIQRILGLFHYVLVSDMRYLYRPRLFDFSDRTDYVRLSCLELVAWEIYRNNIIGSVAEVGVYRGDFAEKINTAFKDRDFYLFDTFSGFATDEIEREISNGHVKHRESFSSTSVQLVLNKMPYPKKCIIRKGRFPDTVTGDEGQFAFVSLDADLFDPIRAGLLFFYPRLNKGGTIFVHDFSTPGYAGVRKAVLEFCQENKIGYVPLSDTGGSVAIVK
jgi:O-methyltransferase